MADANLDKHPGWSIDYTPVAAVTAGDIVHLPDGRAARAPTAIAAGELGAVDVQGICTVTKTTSVYLTDGQPVYWDHSAKSATYAPASDEDFFLGSVIGGDAAAADTTVKVALNVWPTYKIDLNGQKECDAFVTALVNAASVSKVGPSARLAFTTATEAQKADLLSRQGFALGSDWIVEAQFTIVDDGDDAAVDFNIGVANGTHASDADSIPESVFIHTDGNVVNILAESDDGTTEVAATDTTIDYTLGTPVHVVLDGRDPSDVQIYINGALVLSGTTFDVSAATGPLKLLAHLEKSSNDSPGEYYIDALRVRTMDL